MKKLGLIGYPLGHSFSKGYFSEKFTREGITDFEYNNYPIESISELHELIASDEQLIGLNVTIPYKEKVLEYLDVLDETAGEIGAVNTIKISRNNGLVSLEGYNTDAYGFEQPLLKHFNSEVHKKALILGTGGAAKAVAWVLSRLGVCITYVSRTPKNESMLSYSQLSSNKLKEYKIIINSSPIGMYPYVDDCPNIPYEMLNETHILYDLIYNPEQTMFLQKGKKRKAITINGLPMLHLQAERAWTIWNS